MKNIYLTNLEDKDKEGLINELKNFYIPYRNTLGLDKKATFGCEIEFNIYGYDSLDVENSKAQNFMNKIGYPYKWKVTSEINSRIEIISDVLSDKKEDWVLLKNILGFLNENKAYSNGKGGSHVHVGNQIIANDFDALELFLKLFACYENEIIRFTNGEYYFDRVQFDYMCKRSKEIIFDMIRKKDFLKRKNVSRLLCSKMSSINFPSTDFYKLIKTNYKAFYYDKSNTTEFRTPSLTLNPVIWQNNINFFVKLMSCMKNKDFDKELLNYRYNKEKDNLFFYKDYSDFKAFELCDLVFYNGLDKMCFLRQYYKDFDAPTRMNYMTKAKPFYKL